MQAVQTTTDYINSFSNGPIPLIPFYLRPIVDFLWSPFIDTSIPLKYLLVKNDIQIVFVITLIITFIYYLHKTEDILKGKKSIARKLQHFKIYRYIMNGTGLLAGAAFLSIGSYEYVLLNHMVFIVIFMILWALFMFHTYGSYKSVACADCGHAFMFYDTWKCQSCKAINEGRRITAECRKCGTKLTALRCPECKNVQELR